MILPDGTEILNIQFTRSELSSLLLLSEGVCPSAHNKIKIELDIEPLPQEEFVKVWDFVDDMMSDGGEMIAQIMETAPMSTIISWYDNMKEYEADE